MAWFRTKQRLVPWLVGLFLVAQLAGIVPRTAHAQPSILTTITQVMDQPAPAHPDYSQFHEHDHGQPSSNLADQCCALHLLFGVVPFAVKVVSIEPLVAPLLDVAIINAGGIAPHRLDRPPR